MARFGQNFLISRSIAVRMVKAAEVNPKDTILEIGPGKGILTEELLKTGAKVVAVEKDTKLFGFLSQKFAEEIRKKELVLLKADIRDLLEVRSQKLEVRLPKFNKVVANIPYYLTGQLLRALLPQTKFGADLAVLMLQKEVAQRISMLDTRYPTERRRMNLLAVSIQVFAKPKIAFYVKKGNFQPRPKVDSAVVVLKRREKDFFRKHKISQEKFFETVKTGFAHPRKLLKNNLKAGDREFGAGSFAQCNVAENARAEDLSLENWACLAKKSRYPQKKTRKTNKKK